MTQLSVNGDGDYDNSTHLMGTGFYSSISLNTLDHAKNLRNSLIIRDVSDHNLASYIQSESNGSRLVVNEKNSITSPSIDVKTEKKGETTTIQMKNSPSLNALSGILNEKSRRAEEKTRLSTIKDESIFEEEGDFQCGASDKLFEINSPNLIDIHDSPAFGYPTVPEIACSSYEQQGLISTSNANNLVPTNNGHTNNPFLMDCQSFNERQESVFRIQSSLQGEPELEASIDPTSKATLVNIPQSEPQVKRSTTKVGASYVEDQPKILSYKDSLRDLWGQSSFEDPPPTYTKYASSSTSDLHGLKQSNTINIGLDSSSEIEDRKTRSRANTLGGPVNYITSSYNSRSANHSGIQMSGKMKNKVEAGKNSLQEKFGIQFKKKNIRNLELTSLPSGTSFNYQGILSVEAPFNQSSPQRPQFHKKRSFFSLFKKKNSKENYSKEISKENSKETTLKKNKQLNKDESDSIPPVSTDSGASLASPATPERLTRKSHSSNTIFSTFRKNREKEELPVLSSNTTPRRESQLDTTSKESSAFSSAKREPHGSNESDVEKSRSEAWNEQQDSQAPSKNIEDFLKVPSKLEADSSQDEYILTRSFQQQKFQPLNNGNSNDIENFQKPTLPFLIRHDAGESLFPKSLDKYEVESILSLERSRSVKSNKSHRKSFTDTLSVNAQSEGMYIMEASCAAISTPDLSKSPTGSILRNGRFDSMTPPNFQKIETTPSEKDNLEDIPRVPTPPQGDVMNSIEDKFNQLVLLDADDDDDYDYDIHSNDIEEKNADIIYSPASISNANFESQESIPEEATHTKNQEDTQLMEDDEELMPEMVEFANLINFGDGINLDIGIPNENFNGEYGKDSRLATGENPIFDLDIVTQLEQNDITNEPIKNSVNQNNAQRANIEEQMSTLDSFERRYDNELISESHHAIGSDRPLADAYHFEGPVVDAFTDIPNDLVDEIRIPSPIPSLEVLEPPHKYQKYHGGRHIFRDILEKSASTSNQQSTHLPVEAPFKGLNAPSLNQSETTYGSPSPNSPMVITENLKSEIAVQPNAKVNFSSKIMLYDTYTLEQYDRTPGLATCNMLTPQLAQVIKAELNELKTEMEVHESSRCYTHFF